MKYRPEVDGLRAVAVLPVIFFHAGLSFFSGGYVGVDVFFVISGYLITTIILNDIDSGKFSLVNFYERRIRRILPALTVVLLACLPFAYYLLMPIQLTEFSQSLISVSLFYSNILFWSKTGYFETISELKPLLHTWSLAVEEQYYLFFPLLLILLSRFSKRITLISLALLGISSLILSQWASGTHESVNFYFLPTRLWELLIGSFVALYFFYKNREQSNKVFSLFASQILSALGLFLILYSISAFDEKTPFPSFYTLLPTVGTALVILFASSKTITGKFLSNRFFVGIGLISYSAYLWHLPVFAFTRIASVQEPDNLLMFALGILSLGLAYLTWKYVETPFRDKVRFNQKRIFQFAAMSSIIIIGIGIVGFIGKGFGNRIAPNGMTYEKIDQLTRHNFGLSTGCAYKSFKIIDNCRTSDSPEILIWGDSFAMHLVPGILASKPDARMIQMTMSACGPILETAIISAKYNKTWAENCIAFNNDVLRWLMDNPSVHYVVLGSPFSQYLDEGRNLLVDTTVMQTDKTIVLSQFKMMLSKLSDIGVKPVIFAPPPSDGNNIGNCLVRNIFYKGLLDCRISLKKYQDTQKDVIAFLKEIEKDYPVVWVSQALCNDTFCNTKLNGVFIYRDWGHLAIEGSAYLGKKMNFYKIITSKENH